MINSHLSCKNSHYLLVYQNRQDLQSDSQTLKLCTGWLRNQDGGKTSEHLKLLTALFVVVPTHDFVVENNAEHGIYTADLPNVEPAWNH